MTRLQIYVAGSAILANIVLLRAYYERPNFYSAAVYISQSTGSLMFLINLALIATASLGYGLQRLFYGPLRAIETEQLYDKAWFAVSETLLAMTIFRDDIGIWFFAMFLCLLAGKVWQWIGEGRVELLEQQPPASPRLFHARLMSSLLLSVAFDISMMNYCIDAILQEARPGVMVMFGFEYVLLAIASISSLMRYGLSLVELAVTHRQEKARLEARRLAQGQAQQRVDAAGGEAEPAVDEEEDEDNEGDVPGWEEKGRWVFYLDLATDFIKSVVYLGFFMILMAFYGIPIHIMRDLFMTVRSFIKRINDFVRYRNATRDMNARYPDATAEELVRENTCIVCREEMRPWVPPGEGRAGRRVDERQRAKKLPCGHILHFSCLRSWLERQQVCPTCRRSVLAEATPQNGPTNNQANQAQQNQGNPQGLQNPQNHQQNVPRIGRLFNMEPQNQQQPNPVGQPGQQAQQAQQALLNRPPNGAAGNMRVFNFGPIRIALGNLRIPNPQQQQGNANEALNNNNVMANLAQQLAQNPNGQVPTPNQPQDQSGTPAPNYHGVTIPASHAVHPTDIQSDILRLQQNIIDSLRVLNAQYGQLEYIHALLGELNRLQQASGVAAPNAQGPSSIQALNSTSGFAPIVPQAYMSSGSVLRQGDSGLPEGLVLPEGWTLRPLAPTTPVGNGGSPTSVVSAQASTAPGATDSEPGTSAVSTTLPQAQSPEAGPSSSATPGTSGSTEKQAEPSSLASSWSFENTRGTSEASGSTSALAGGNTGNQNTPKRSATVEDTEDSGQ